MNIKHLSRYRGRAVTEPHPQFTTSFDEDQNALRQLDAGQGSALCTIVRIDGSFSRRVGGQLAVSLAGQTYGSLSDGCLERELASRALAMISRNQRAECLRFGKASPFVDFRLPCGSGVDILIDPEPDANAIRQAVSLLDARQPSSVPLPIGEAGLLARRHYMPSLRLVICGAGPESEWLAKLATAAGIASIVLGPSAGLHLGTIPEWLALDPWTAVVLLFHDHEWERALLKWALASDAFYVGAMGGEKAREDRVAFLSSARASDEQISRVIAPIGVIKGARDARLLALSILSEVAGSYETLRTC